MEETPEQAKPRDARTVESILLAMGVQHYDNRVVTQLLELLYRYVSSALSDARVYSEHAEKPAIELDDVKLAIQSHCSFAFTQPPPRDVTMKLAAERNAIPLPPVDLRAGVALPPNEYRLTAANYEVKVRPTGSPKRKRSNIEERKKIASPRISKVTRSPGKKAIDNKIGEEGKKGSADAEKKK